MAPQNKTVEFSVKVPCEIVKKAKWYLACCPVLDVHSQGETKEKAKTNLREAVSLFLISCFERGVLDAALKDCGFTPSKEPATKGPSIAVREKIHEEYLDVPIPFLVQPKHQVACRA